MSYTVDAVSKAMDLLLLVAEQPGLGVTELARRSGNTKARAFRLLGTLSASGLVKRQEPAATYSLGYRALLLGVAARVQIQLSQLGASLLPEIGQECGENVLISVRQGLETLCVSWWDAPHALRVHSETSGRRPLHVGASGKLLLAYAPADIQDQVLNEERKRFTPNTIVTSMQLRQSIERIRELGHSMSYGEKSPDTIALAVPVFDVTRQAVACLSMTAPVIRMPDERVHECLELLQHGAMRLSRQLGYRPQDTA